MAATSPCTGEAEAYADQRLPVFRVRMSGGHLCEAEAPTEAAEGLLHTLPYYFLIIGDMRLYTAKQTAVSIMPLTKVNGRLKISSDLISVSDAGRIA